MRLNNFCVRPLICCLLTLASLVPVHEAAALSFKCTATCAGIFEDYTKVGTCSSFGDLRGDCCKQVCRRFCDGAFWGMRDCRAHPIKARQSGPWDADSQESGEQGSLRIDESMTGDADFQQEDPVLSSEEINQILLEAAGLN